MAHTTVQRSNPSAHGNPWSWLDQNAIDPQMAALLQQALDGARAAQAFGFSLFDAFQRGGEQPSSARPNAAGSLGRFDPTQLDAQTILQLAVLILENLSRELNRPKPRSVGRLGSSSSWSGAPRSSAFSPGGGASSTGAPATRTQGANGPQPSAARNSPPQNVDTSGVDTRSIPDFASLNPKLQDAARVALSMGLTVTSTTGGKHAAGSYHYSARAIDVAGSPDQMARFYDRYAGTNPTELFYDPRGGIKHGQQIGAIGGHGDHVHLAI